MMRLREAVMRARQFKSTVQNFLQRERDLEKTSDSRARELQEKGYKSIVPDGLVRGANGIYTSPDYNPDDEPPTLEELLENSTIQPESKNRLHTVVDNEKEMIRLLDNGYELIKELSNDRYLLKQL
jgi:hypothetical protein